MEINRKQWEYSDCSDFCYACSLHSNVISGLFSAAWNFFVVWLLCCSSSEKLKTHTNIVQRADDTQNSGPGVDNLTELHPCGKRKHNLEHFDRGRTDECQMYSHTIHMIYGWITHSDAKYIRNDEKQKLKSTMRNGTNFNLLPLTKSEYHKVYCESVRHVCALVRYEKKNTADDLFTHYIEVSLPISSVHTYYEKNTIFCSDFCLRFRFLDFYSVHWINLVDGVAFYFSVAHTQKRDNFCYAHLFSNFLFFFSAFYFLIHFFLIYFWV